MVLPNLNIRNDLVFRILWGGKQQKPAEQWLTPRQIYAFLENIISFKAVNIRLWGEKIHEAQHAAHIDYSYRQLGATTFSNRTNAR